MDQREQAARLAAMSRRVRELEGAGPWPAGPAGAYNLAHGAWRTPAPAAGPPVAGPAGPEGAGAAPAGSGPPSWTGGRAGVGLVGLGAGAAGAEAGTGAGLAGLSAAQVAAGVRRGNFSPSEVLDAVLQRISALQPELNAFITVTPDQARTAARAAAGQRSGAGSPHLAGPLGGVTVAVKDVIMTAGVPTTCGSRICRGWVPEADATVVRRLRQAGAVMVGKTNTHEFAFGPTTVNPHYGPCRNPHHTARVAGGSSGGSAVAVATGQAHLALGTDTGGSIRIPAAACGVVGLKPTYGRISKAGVLPLAWSLDHVGPIGRTVEDVALALDVLAGPDGQDETTAVAVPHDDWRSAAREVDRGLVGLRVGLPAGWDSHRVQPAVREAVRRAARRCEHWGAAVREVGFPSAEVMMLANRLIILAEAAAYHRPWLERFPEEYGPDVRARLELGRAIPAGDYLAGQRLRSELARQVAAVMANVDVLLVPSLPFAAPLIGQAQVEWEDGPETVPDGLIRLVAPFNVTGGPALALPYGVDGAGMPVSVQIVGRPFEEAVVLRTAAVLEADGPGPAGA